MSAAVTETPDDAPDIRRLTFDLDVEICVIGGGVAGLVVAIEAAQMGASVALLEAKRVGWGASAHNLGTVRTGYDVSPQAVIARVGRNAASELWRMSQTGADIVRALASKMDAVGLRDGALELSNSEQGNRVLNETIVLGTEFGIHAQHWSVRQVRDTIASKYYFEGLFYPRAFQIDASAYVRGLAAIARQAGVRIFEETSALSLDISGARKRVKTASALLRASHIVLAGNTSLGDLLPRLAATLLPVWRYGVVTTALPHLEDKIDFEGSISDIHGIDHFRVLDDNRLMWSSPQTTWQARPDSFEKALRRRIRRILPDLGPLRIAQAFGGATGCTVHGMPQIGQLRPGLWVSSGFGRQGLNTTAMAGRIIAQGILHGDDRWRLFSPFDLIWAGGKTGQVAGYAIEWAARSRAAAAGLWARRREIAVEQRKLREARIAAMTKRIAPPAGPVPEAAAPAPPRTPLPSPFLDLPVPEEMISQEQETISQESEQKSGSAA